MAQHHGIHFGVDIEEPPMGTPVPPRPRGGKDTLRGYPLLDDALNTMNNQELDFVCLPMMQQHAFEPFGRSARILQVTSWCSMVVGKVATWSGNTKLDYDSEDQAVAQLSCDILRKEIAYASHSTLPAIMLELPNKASPNLARILLSTILKSMSYVNVWVRVPLMMGDSRDPEDNTAWLMWNALRTLCHNHNRLNVMLEVTPHLPKPEILQRWVAEPIKGLVLNTALFSHEKDGCSLTDEHQNFLMMMHRFKSQVILSGKVHPRLGSLGIDMRYYKNYVVNTKATMQFTDQEREEAPYHDYLQAPLQPLMDNLESQTYEVFEKDPVKYAQYEEAAFQAMTDMKKEITDRKLVLMIVGAGRGPLVKGAINAAKRSQTDVKVYAVEKNPNAIVTLRGLLRSKDWEGIVEIVESDMRVWDAPDQADIMISELLGSFGDNELSPECLDGAERFLRKGGVMIPESYRSYLAPLQSHKLHTDVLAYDDLTHIETAYVVKIHSGFLISDAKQCFEYVHPKPALPYPQSNDRMLTITWTAKEDALCHGFAGYFDATLYKDVMISIHPETFSEGMFSWFSIYFPIKTPQLIKKGDTITATYWRITGNGKVWYEWCMTSPQLVPVHNPNGRSYWVGL